jgi:hypothetical protein
VLFGLFKQDKRAGKPEIYTVKPSTVGGGFTWFVKKKQRGKIN